MFPFLAIFGIKFINEKKYRFETRKILKNVEMQKKKNSKYVQNA